MIPTSRFDLPTPEAAAPGRNAVPETVEEFFEYAAGRLDKSRLRGPRTYVFDVEAVGKWTVKVADGTLTVHAGGDKNDCDCAFVTSEEIFLRIARKEQNPTLAYMTGKLKVHGNMVAATALLGEMKSFGLL